MKKDETPHRGAAKLARDNRFLETIRLEDLWYAAEREQDELAKSLVDCKVVEPNKLVELGDAALRTARAETAWRHSKYGNDGRERPVADHEAGKAIFALGMMFLRKIQSMAGYTPDNNHLPGDMAFDLFWDQDCENWQLSIYETASEVIGGATDGEQHYAGFLIEDISDLIVLLDPEDGWSRVRVQIDTEVHGRVSDGPSVSLHGQFKGQNVAVVIYLEPQDPIRDKEEPEEE